MTLENEPAFQALPREKQGLLRKLNDQLNGYAKEIVLLNSQISYIQHHKMAIVYKTAERLVQEGETIARQKAQEEALKERKAQEKKDKKEVKKDVKTDVKS